MLDVLNKDEIEQLRPLRLSTEEKLSELSIPLNALVDENVLLWYMEKVGAHIGSPNLQVTASIFVKRYAFLAVIYLYGITAWNKKLNASLNNISIQTEEAEDLWLPKFYFHNIKIEIAEENRYQWREEALKDFFSENVHVLIDQLAKVTKQSKLILWENIAIYLFWLYESVLQKLDNEELRNRAKEDFHYLVYEAPGSLFGNDHENLIKRYYHNKRYKAHLQEEVRVRTTCCFSYLLEGATNRCKTCPQTCNVKRRKE
ncbi:(2Fe-2S)-binding protein [Bacillus sp. V3B]|uniref:(2Fe-2S)-binding protein n=1 Tax=Bacillus sp. V3B TaxID=2804915 RepID=UPI00210C21F7|nr:IucA/IucC family C-terminal-domain containing protein [Bacillus sp. V3B]MCQ6275234.1 (2Fe-2S)-binding protein [Bacillus sp. V3B]